MTEQEQAEFDRLKKRLANTEVALQAVWAHLKPLMPPDTQSGVDKMMQDHFYINGGLGAEFDGINYGDLLDD